MATLTTEQRLAALEAEIAQLRQEVGRSQRGPDAPGASWLDKVYGAFAGDPYFKEAMELGRKYRESLRPKPRKKRKPKNGNS